MSGDFPFSAKIVSPVKCNEKPWDLWVSEIGHLSPRRDEDVFEAKGGASARRAHDAHPYKPPGAARYRRAGINRLKHESMSLHGLFPQMDNLNAAVCHMCGVVVKCSAAYRHMLESHTESEPILPPPAAPTVKLKVHSKSRIKNQIPPAPLPLDILPVKMETSPVHTATAPLNRLVLPQPDMYLDESSTAPLTGEVQVCVESGELPVVSIQDTEELPLGENITDDIFEIMDSEGIQRADDLTNPTDWKNIIRDIGNMQDINFSQSTDSQSQDFYSSVDTLPAYALTEPDLTNLPFAPNATPLVASVIDPSVANVQPVKPSIPSTPQTKRSKASKTKFNLREYDPNKHCGVVTAENPKPCTRSLTCKAHALSLRRTVEGRCKPFDTLLAEHRASRDASLAPAPAQPPPPPAPLVPPILVNSQLDLGYNGLTAEQQVNDIYASLLSVEDPNAVLPDTSSLTSFLSQSLPADLLLPDEVDIPPDVPILSIASPVDSALNDRGDDVPPPVIPSDVCWYSSCPRPLALCTFNASHAGGSITLGKRFATVRSNIKSSLTRSQCKTSGTNNYYYNQNTLSLSKTVHMNASKTNKPEVRKLIVTCNSAVGTKEVQQTISDLFAGEVRHTLNGHVPHTDRKPLLGGSGLVAGGLGVSALKHVAAKRAPPPVLDLSFALDPLLADEKC